MLPLWKPRTLKLANFAYRLNGREDGYFEWSAPTAFAHLRLTQPLKLEAIYVKWRHNFQPSAIQLEFEGGLKSELFDTRNIRAQEERRIDLKGLKITSISSRVENITYMRQLAFNHKRGQLQIFDTDEPAGSVETRQIEEGHEIVGVYGRLWNNFCQNIGFIVAKI